MKFVNQLRESSNEAPKTRASRPVVRPKKNKASKDAKNAQQDEQFLFI